MSGFSDVNFVQKLQELNSSAQSIQQLSLWIMHHRKHYKNVVKLWFKEIYKAPRDRKLTYLYLANDVVQNSKKKFPEFPVEFGTVMKKVMEHLISLKLDEKTGKSIGRLLTIWKERAIFDLKVQNDIHRIWHSINKSGKEEVADTDSIPAKRAKIDTPVKKPKSSPEKAAKEAFKSAETNSNASQKSPSELLKAFLNPETKDSACPPDSEKLIQSLQELENSASSDAAVRDKISKFPAELTDPSQLDKISSLCDAKELLKKVDEADKFLNDYNKRLEKELADRKNIGKLMEEFIASQRHIEQIVEGKIEEFKDKLEKVNGIRDELRSHIQSLPDLTKLPDVTTGNLAPLPSAGDLFTMK